MYPNLHNFSIFGFGQWVCLGRNIAERSLDIGVAWGCEIKKDGRLAGEYDYTTGFNVQPKNFVEGFKLRTRRGRGKVVGKEWKSVWETKSV